MRLSDFRSDTVTRPTPAMLAHMGSSPLGDDVYGEDPTVNRLEAMTAELLGKEAALWLPSGTQANLVALLTHCQRGDEYIAGQQAHCYRSEGGGAAVCGGIQPQPLDFLPDGTLDLDAVTEAVKPDDPHYTRTRLLCLENTRAGRALPLAYLTEARRLCDRLGLALHLDGARLLNAALASGSSAAQIAASCDTLTLCLSKGLGAPAGSMLAGTRAFIAEARRWRKMLGGGLRQAGVLAAAGMYALEHHVERLVLDHDRARQLAAGLAEYPLLNLDPSGAATNMVFAFPGLGVLKRYRAFLGERGILVGGYGELRFVTHLDLEDQDVERLLEATRDFFS